MSLEKARIGNITHIPNSVEKPGPYHNDKSLCQCCGNKLSPTEIVVGHHVFCASCDQLSRHS